MNSPSNQDLASLIDLAVSQHRDGHYVEAGQGYRAILGHTPNDPVINNNYGVLLMQCQQLQEARSFLARGYQLAPREDHARNYAHCLFHIGAWEALRDFADGLPSALQATAAPYLEKAFGVRQDRKVFCIGHNKTGTTSLESALSALGLECGLQARGEILFRDWVRRDFRRILQLAQTADVFQDIPFSLDYTYVALDQHFPGSKFILTVRDDTDAWYRSITRFHSNIVNGGAHLPTAEEMSNYEYRYRGFLWETAQGIYGIDERNVYDRDMYTRYYERHNANIIEYFRNRPSDLLILNLSDSSAMKQLGTFLGIDCEAVDMPHLNRSA